jgi:superfamily II DNA or RNA helicase
VSDRPIALRDVELAPWQVEAVDAWCSGDGKPFTGTLEIFTGGGKTLMALGCVERAARVEPGLQVAVVVPSEALARQWREVIAARTTVAPEEVGLMGAGGRDQLGAGGAGPRVLVAVLNSAAKRLPEGVTDPDRTMLIVDECHRAGAPKLSRVLETKARFRLGLSATPDREELDDDGEPLTFDEQIVGRKLGGVVFRWMLRDAMASGWLPTYRIHHHGVQLRPHERTEYEVVSRRVDDAIEQLEQLGFDGGRAQLLRGRDGDVGQAANAYLTATAARKDLLYRADERHRLAVRLVHELLATDPGRRIILFHERIDEAIAVFQQLTIPADGAAEVSHLRPAVEHSKLPDRERRAALEGFRDGSVNVLVSVKSLIEGIDVPAADVGISVASSSSVRQRIQSLGRVLRRRFDDPEGKRAEMHVIYVADSVDEVIYGKTDWADITGEGTNAYWIWSLDDPSLRDEKPGPPRTPRPTEEMEWQRLGSRVPDSPLEWLGSLIGQEYSVDTMGTVTNASKSVIANPQGVGRMVERVRGRPGGKFRVTPQYRLVLVWAETDGGGHVVVAGGLDEPFRSIPDLSELDQAEVSWPLRPGDVLPGLPDRIGGVYFIRQRRGGLIERKTSTGVEWAYDAETAAPDLAQNAIRVVEAWRGLLDRGITFFVSSGSFAWFVDEGMPRFLADVPGGFAWPTPHDTEQR